MPQLQLQTQRRGEADDPAMASSPRHGAHSSDLPCGVVLTVVKVEHVNKFGHPSTHAEEDLELLSLRTLVRAVRFPAVRVHRRKTRGTTYESPRIILPRAQADLIGKRCRIYRGRAVSRGDSDPREGECLVLFFPDQWLENQD